MIKTYLKTSTYFKFSKFVYFGVISYFLNVFLTFFLTDIVGMYYFFSYTTVLTFIIVLNFIANIRFTFKVAGRYKKRFTKYVVAVFIFMFSNLLLVRLFTNHFRLHYLISIFFVNGCLMVLKFIVYDNLIFNK